MHKVSIIPWENVSGISSFMGLKLKNTDNRIRKWKSDALIVSINQIQIEMFKCFDFVLTQRCIE